MSQGHSPKFPIKGFGNQAWGQGGIADATIRLGSSGMVATCFGMQGFSATLVATGFYELRFPPTPRYGTRIYPQAQPPESFGATGVLLPPQWSGALPNFDARVTHVGSESGYAFLSTSTSSPTPSAVGAATGLRSINPPTGSIIQLQFLVGPAIGRF